MKKELLYLNYIKSLEQKYNAVCFDIDGTLTIEGTKTIDSRAIDMIIDLLKKKIPVVFITGRGETGLGDLKNDIYNRIKNEEGITENDIKRIYVLTNDGARLFYSTSASQDDFLSSNVYVSTEEELNQLTEVNEFILKLSKIPDFIDFFNVTYSKDSVTGKIINVRLVVNTESESLAEKVFNKIDSYIANRNFKGVNLTRGIYKDKIIFQIGTATKDKAIERTEEIIGVTKNSMMRIGDCGDLRGNDYSMLNCNQGYSVDKTSGSNNSCFPVFDDAENIIKGVEATLRLIKIAKILPTVCLEKANKDHYKKQFARIEGNIVLGRQKLLKGYNDIINSNFNVCTGIDDLFDKSSGSIKLPMYEIEMLDNNPLKELWLSSINGTRIYSIRDDNNYLLRGSSTYYYFIANRKSVDGKDITSKIDVMNWYKNYIKFLEDSAVAVSSTFDLNDTINKKLLLGILDNCRNVLLVLLNHYLVSMYYDKNILLDISSNQQIQYFETYGALIEIEKIMSKMCFENQHIVSKDYIVEAINSTRKVLQNNIDAEFNRDEKEDYSKDYRAYREIDSFAENYIAVSLYNKKCNNIESINACGLSYGGIELPVLAKIISQDRIDKILLLKFNKEVSGYTNKQLIDLRNFNINSFGGLINPGDIMHTNVDLFDDNVLTGKTLQLAINSLYDNNIGVQNICIVRYPSINRIDQMFLDVHAAIDYNLFFNYIYGLGFSSPYSWKDDDWKEDNGRIDYTDSLGVFDLNRKKIVECLLKNHDYSEQSEVGEYKRRLIK